MIQQTFEASDFWREVLRNTFFLKERKVEVDNFEIFLWKHPLYPRWVSTPYRDRLAISWQGRKNIFSRDKYRELARACKNFILKDVTPLLISNEEMMHFKGHTREQYTNSDVILDNNIETRLHRSAKKNWRRAREEYSLIAEINPVFSFEEFYDMYLRTRIRLGVLPYPRKLFHEIFEGIGNNAAVFQCRDESRCYGYLICYLHNSEIISGHICYDFNERHRKIPDFLFISAFQWAVQRGFNIYRFGGDYNNQESLIAAKVKLGAVPRPQCDLVSSNPKLSTDRPNSWQRRLLRSMPRPIFRHTHLLTAVYFE